MSIKLCISSDYEKLYIYIQLYIRNKREPLGIISRVRAQYLPLFVRGGWGGQEGLLGGSSPNRVPAPHSGSVTSRTTQNLGVRVALPGRRLLAEGGSADRHSHWIVFGLKCPTAQDFWGPGPLGKSGVHPVTWCPSLLSALRRSVCQPCQCSRVRRSPASASLSLFCPET